MFITDDVQQKSQLLVGLMEGVDQGLEAGEVSEELVDPQYPHHSH